MWSPPVARCQPGWTGSRSSNSASFTTVPTPYDPSPTPRSLPRTPCPGGTGKRRQCWAVAGGTHCRNHDPALAERRRLNGCVRHKEPPVAILRTELGPGGEYRKPSAVLHLVAPPGGNGGGLHPSGKGKLTRAELRAQQAQEAADRAEAVLNAAEPPAADLRRLAVNVLKDIAIYGGESPRVQAALGLLKQVAPQAADEAGLQPGLSLDEALAGYAETGTTRQ